MGKKTHVVSLARITHNMLVKAWRPSERVLGSLEIPQAMNRGRGGGSQENEH